MTRVAGANPRIWVDIFLDNREALARRPARAPAAARTRCSAALEAGDAGYLARWIGAGRRRTAGARSRRSSTSGPRSWYRVQVHVPDRPGVISGITQALGAARINIEDFELHHFTPERGGTIELARRRARRPPSAPSSCSTRRATARSPTPRRRRTRVSA